MQNVSPATFARRVTSRERIHVPEESSQRLSSLMRVLDLAPYAALDNDTHPSAVRYHSLLQPAPLAREFITDWVQALVATEPFDVQLTPAEALLFEWFLSWDPLAVTAALPRGYRYLKTVHVSRQRAAVALHDYARGLGWRRPVVHVAALRVARAYCRILVLNSHLTRAEARHQFSGRLGVASILMARFVELPLTELREAVALIDQSVHEGNNPASGLEYWLEGQVRIFEQTLEVIALRRAVEQAERAIPSRPSVSLQIQLAGIALRLREPAVAGLSDFHELRASLGRALRNRSLPVEENLAIRMLVGLVEEEWSLGTRLAAGDIPILPFDVARRSLNPALRPFLPRLILELGSPEVKSEPLARSLSADLLLHLHGSTSANSAQLRERIALRSYPSGSRGDDRNWLLQCRDQLLLASIDDKPRSRARVIENLINRGLSSPSTAASALILVAKDVELNGRCAATLPPDHARLTELLQAGDMNGLLIEAAKQAERSPDLLPEPLGGRSNVTTVGDLYDLAGEMFIFKEVQLEALERESTRAAYLTDRLVLERLDNAFKVCTPRLLRTLPNNKGVTVRRFETGKSAREVIADDPSRAEHTLAELARYLGWMNRTEGLSIEQAGRADIKAREVGMWLKSLGYRDWSVFFDLWWSAFDGIPGAPRRDAHLDNWIISPSGRVIAIDLEAQSRRPLGYEVAQITEDGAHLPPDDWKTRWAVMEAYAKGLDSATPGGDLRVAFEGSVMARALRHLTMPRDGGRYVRHGLATLKTLEGRSGSELLRDLAARVLDAYAANRGGTSEFGSRTLGPAERRRLSKRLAFLLRHSETADRDPNGWVDLTSAAAHLGISVATLVEAATHPDERRFQVSAGSVRALYGHSVAVELDFRSPPVSDRSLFHGTSMENAADIVIPSGGLRRISRQWVHLTTSASDAYEAATRKGHPVVLAIAARGLTDLMSATQTTVLVRFVPAQRVRLAPIGAIWESIGVIHKPLVDGE